MSCLSSQMFKNNIVHCCTRQTNPSTILGRHKFCINLDQKPPKGDNKKEPGNWPEKLQPKRWVFVASPRRNGDGPLAVLFHPRNTNYPNKWTMPRIVC